MDLVLRRCWRWRSRRDIEGSLASWNPEGWSVSYKKERDLQTDQAIQLLKEIRMSVYIRPQSAGEILRNAMHLYRRNFREFFLVYLIPLLPFSIVYIIAVDTASLALSIIAQILYFLATVISVMPVTVVLSDICLGNEPGVRRAFRRVFDRSAGQLFWTLLLVVGITILGLLLCVVPGFIFGAWYQLAFSIVVLERVGGWAALRRSKNLGQEFYLRNWGLIFLCNIICFSGAFAVGIFFGIVSYFTGLHQTVAKVATMVLSLPLAPLPLITIVLIYYDMRSRKEAYDNAALAEDLRR